MKKHSYSIYRHIVVIVLIPFIILTLLLLGTYEVYRASMFGRSQEEFALQMEQYRLRLEERLNNIRNTAREVGYSEAVQKYFVQMNNAQRADNYIFLRNLFNTFIDATPGVRAIYVVDESGAFLDSGNNLLHYFQRAGVEYDFDGQTEGFFTDILPEGVNESPRYCLYCAPVGVITPISLGQKERFLTCALLVDVPELLAEIAPGEPPVCELLFWQERILASSRALNAGAKSALVAAATAVGGTVHWQIEVAGEPYFFQTATLSTENGLVYAFSMPVNHFIEGTDRLKSFVLVGVGGCVAVVAVLMLLLRRSISRPIAQIAQDMAHITTKQISIGDTNVVELQNLASGVNRMLSRLTESQRQEMENMEKIHQLEMYKMQAEMLALRSQINPHFLFNTLGCVIGMAMHYRVEPLEQIVTALSDSLHYALRAPDEVTLQQEIDHLQDYMRILEIRMPDKYRLVVHAAPETLEKRVLSLLLQPLAENAVQHGFQEYQKRAERTIYLASWIDAADGGLRLRLADNGRGIEADHLAGILEQMNGGEFPAQKRHIALINIARRLRIAYGDQCHMDIRSKPGYYTCVELQFPAEGRFLR